MQKRKDSATGVNYMKRAFRGLSYLSFVVGAGFSIAHPSNIISDLTSTHYATAWGVLFFISAGICFTGVVLGNWVVEYVGLPLLSVVFVILGICMMFSITPQTTYLTTFSFTSWGVGVYFLTRFIELKKDLNK